MKFFTVIAALVAVNCADALQVTMYKKNQDEVEAQATNDLVAAADANRAAAEEAKAKQLAADKALGEQEKAKQAAGASDYAAFKLRERKENGLDRPEPDY